MVGESPPALVIRPAPERLKSWWWRFAVVIVGIAIAFTRFLLTPRTALTAAILLLVALAAAGIVFLLSVRGSSLYVDDEQFGQTTWLGHGASYPRSTIAKVVRRTVPGGMGSSAEFTLVLDQQNRRLVAFQRGGWFSAADKEAYIQRLGVEIEPADPAPQPLKSLTKEFPGELTRWYNRQIWLAVWIAVAVTAVVSVLAVPPPQ